MSGWGYVFLAWGGTAAVLGGYVGWLFRRAHQLRAVEARPWSSAIREYPRYYPYYRRAAS